LLLLSINHGYLIQGRGLVICRERRASYLLAMKKSLMEFKNGDESIEEDWQENS
jgi:hypothetical protein